MRSSGNFGKRWSCTLDGTVYAQPLYVANLSIGGGISTTCCSSRPWTMHDTLYAFDADNPGCVTYWTRSFISPSPGSNIAPMSTANSTCNDVLIEYGISGTAVIDPSSRTIYCVTNTTENGSNYFQRLRALDITTGADRANSRQPITASLPGTTAAAVSYSIRCISCSGPLWR